MVATVSVGTKGWADRINAAWFAGVKSAFGGWIETGSILNECKSTVPHGAFTEMLETELKFKADTAQRLMAVARDHRLTNAANLRFLPPHYMTLHALTKLSDDEFAAALKDGTIRPDMERKDVPKPHKTSANGSTSPSRPSTITDAEYTEERSPVTVVTVGAVPGDAVPDPGSNAGAHSPHDLPEGGNREVTESPAAVPLSPGESAVPVEAPVPTEASLVQAAAPSLAPGGEVDTREGGDTRVSLDEYHAATAGLALCPPVCPPDMVAYYIRPGDPMSGFTNGLAIMMAAVEQFIADERSHMEVAHQYKRALYPDDLTKFVSWMMDFDDLWRKEYPVGNEAAMQEAEAGG